MENQTQKLPTPRGMRAHIALCGPCNGGKSSLLNALTKADVAMVSPQAGTTTDPVYKNMELLPHGPVTFIDTPGLDDTTMLGKERVARARSALAEADLVCLVCRPDQLGGFPVMLEEMGLAESGPDSPPVVLVISHSPQGSQGPALMKEGGQAAHGPEPQGTAVHVSEPHEANVRGTDAQGSLARRLLGKEALAGINYFLVDSPSGGGIDSLQKGLCALLDQHRKKERKLLEDLVRPCRLVLMVVPIDLEAPAGRLILPQVQAIREVLDSDAATLVVKERELEWALSLLRQKPDLAITDSQVVLKAASTIPEDIPLTTFSILFSRQKGDLEHFVESARVIDDLKDGDRVLVAETCTHRSSCDDIGQVKIPRWLRQYTGRDLDIQNHTGPLPPDLASYRLVIHCGGCMITRRMMLSRLDSTGKAGVPVTNYGMAISKLQGVLDRVVKPLGL